jgi:DNA-binding transcriptional LysR family regulator
MLNLERLRVLHAVSTTGSVVGAARTLHVTTSAVSQQLTRLEREVAQRLIEKQGRGIRLTEAGTVLAGYAAELLNHVEQVEAGLAQRSGAVAGPLTVAAFATAARGLVPGVVAELHARYPHLQASISEQEPHEAIPAVRRGDLDLAVVQDWAHAVLDIPEGLVRRDLFEDAFDVALPDGHRLADRDRVGIAELADDDWISWTSGQICHDWLTHALRRAGAIPRIRHTASEHATQLAMVAAGLGVAVIPRLGRDPVPPPVRIVPIEPTPVRRIFAVWRSSVTARPAIQALLDALRVSPSVAIAVVDASRRQPAGSPR